MVKRPQNPIFDVLPPRQRITKRLKEEEILEESRKDEEAQKEKIQEREEEPVPPIGEETILAESEPMPFNTRVEKNIEEISAEFSEKEPDSFLQKLANDKKRTPPLGDTPLRPRLMRFLIIGAVGAIAIFGSAWWISANFARATITLFTDRTFAPVNFEVELNTALTVPDFAIKQLPLQALEKTIERTTEHPTTGTANVSSAARGTVRIHNRLAIPQQLIVRTRLESQDRKIFRLAAPVRIPANGNVEAEVIADQAGADYNIGPTRFTFPGFREQGLTERYQNIYAESQEPFRGGALGETKVVNQEDIRKAKEQLSRDVLGELDIAIRNAIPEGFILIDQGAVRLSVNNISANAQIGEARETFSVTLNARATALIFEEEHIAELARLEVESPNLIDAIPDARFDLAYTLLQPPDFTRGILRLRVNGNLNVARSINIDLVKERIAGMGEAMVQHSLIALPGIKESRVSLWPFWITRVPQNLDRITIEMQ